MKNSDVYKKLFALSLVGTLSLSHPHLAKANNNYNQHSVTYLEVPTVTAVTTVNVRSGANINSAKIGTLYAGQSVRLYEEIGDWYKVGYGTTIAYVNKYYFVQTNQAVMNPTTKIKTIRLDTAMEMYSDENCTYHIGTVPAGALVNVYLDNPYTYFINYNGKAGYISKQIIHIYPAPTMPPAPPVTPAPTPVPAPTQVPLPIHIYDSPVVPYQENNYYYQENNYYYQENNNYYGDNKTLVKK